MYSPIAQLDRELAQLRRKLSAPHDGPGSGGVAFFFVPAFRLLWTSLDDEVGHVTRFTRRSLTLHLQDAGFEIMRVEYFDSVGSLAALAVRALEKVKLFKYSGGSIRFYDRSIFPVSRHMDAICRHFVGKNLFAVARRA